MATKKKRKEVKYDSGVNILGSVPDYSKMLDFISDTYGLTHESTGTFEFRTEKSVQRFIGAIEACILLFKSDSHKQMFFAALADKVEDKVQDIKEEVAEKVEDVKEEVAEKVEDVKEKVKK